MEIDKDLKWGSHIENVFCKADRSLEFIKRNLSMCPKKIKCATYYTLVRLQLEYASVAWDPYLKTQKESLERVQKRAARFAANGYSTEKGSMTKVLRDLEWPSLEDRRTVARLTFFYKIFNKHVDIEIPNHITQQECNSRGSGIKAPKFVQIATERDTHTYSFHPRTIVDWNSTPPGIRKSPSTGIFKNKCAKFFNVFVVVFVCSGLSSSKLLIYLILFYFILFYSFIYFCLEV